MAKFNTNDPLYYPRFQLAQNLVRNLSDGISSAFTLFAPRRMGKTQFLLNDITPSAKAMGFNVFYFSFMSENVQAVQADFKTALMAFHDHIRPTTHLQKVKRLDFLGIGLEKQDEQQNTLSISDILNFIAKDDKPTLMLLDEVQELARMPNSEGVIRSLRTGLDINKDQLKVIFTGSSTNGLRAMFNDNKAPFFHFSHAINFPTLDQGFTDFLADIYQQRTGNQIDKTAFFQLFTKLNYTPLYLRAITQDMIINPALSLEEAAHIRLQQMYEQSDYQALWQKLSALEKLLLMDILNGEAGFYKAEKRQQFAQKLGVNEISTSSLQTALKKLERHELISKQTDNTFTISNSLFQHWLQENI